MELEPQLMTSIFIVMNYNLKEVEVERMRYAAAQRALAAMAWLAVMATMV